MICSGINATTGLHVEVEFEETIRSVREIPQNSPHSLHLAPGFVDLQINGFAGVDFNNSNASSEDLDRAFGAILGTGVTRCFPTVITASPDSMLASLTNLHRMRRQLRYPAVVTGFHVEGPHIDPSEGPRGAHPVSAVRPPDFEEFQRWQGATEGSIRIVTLSPHWPDAPRYIERVCAAGVVAAIGHTAATSAQIAAAVDAGATLSTHLGNAAPRLVPKFPNCLFDQLADDRLCASFIADGFHLDPAFLRAAVRAKGVERTILVTDAAAPAGAASGDYRLGEVDVELTHDQRVVLRGGTRLAGSALSMDRGIMNLAGVAGVRLRDAMEAATVNPARIARIPGRDSGIAEGQCGDIVTFRLTDRIEIVEVYLDGGRCNAAQ